MLAPRTFLLVFLLLLLACAAADGRAGDLYTGESPLEPGASGRNAEIAGALDEVLTRLTGETEDSLVERFELDSSQLRLLVLSEQRIRRQRPSPDGESMIEELRVRVDFDPQGVDRLLAERNVPRLGRERPSILLWLALEDEDGVRLDGDPLLEDLITHHARRLGLDVIRPLGDLQDLAEIEPIDVRDGFLDSAEPSARRYGAGMISMADLRAVESGWEARWFWRLEGFDDGMLVNADSQASAVAAGLERLLSVLADRFAVIPGRDDGGIRRVRVEGIDDETRYVEVLRYLLSLGSVDDLRLISARGRQVDFELDLASSGFEDALRIGGVLDVTGRSADGVLLLRLSR